MTKDHTSDTPGTPSMPQQPPDVAFSAFHQMNRAEYVRYAETLLHDRHDAEEATDSAFEQLCRKWDQVLPKENPAASAWTILRNNVIDHARARDRRPPPIDDAAFDTVALRDAIDPMGQVTETLALLRALRQLTERQHDVMVMTYPHGLPATAAAPVLGMTSATVRSTIRRSLRRLNEILGLDRTTVEGPRKTSTPPKPHSLPGWKHRLLVGPRPSRPLDQQCSRRPRNTTRRKTFRPCAKRWSPVLACTPWTTSSPHVFPNRPGHRCSAAFCSWPNRRKTPASGGSTPSAQATLPPRTASIFTTWPSESGAKHVGGTSRPNSSRSLSLPPTPPGVHPSSLRTGSA
ncbi:RNA polymerase sigma factor [Streptomyces sp. NPDC001279]|uniref:RNA polymerase sigma factor n=1 Tax=Streptomyces sp. NPDC001279 TaxID=3364556 RepID=UPI0036ADFCFE